MNNLRKAALFGIVLFLAVSSGRGGVAAAEVRDEIVASVNGGGISVRDLRESLGLLGGGVQATWIPLEKKKEALDRLIVARLLEQSARAKGLDNTVEFREAMARNEQGIAVNALVRQEAASRMKVTKEEVREEAGKLRKKDKNLSVPEARARASTMVWQSNFRRFQEELVAQARMEASATIDEEAIDRIGKGGTVEDNTILGTVGGEPVRYGEVKKTLGAIPGGKHAGGDLSNNPVVVRNLVNRELTGMSLRWYAREQAAADSEWMTTVRREAERAALVSLLVENVIMKKVSVTDKEIQDAYARHSGMLVRDGKPIPLPEVREKIREIVLADKRKAAIDKYVAPLRKKAKIRTNEKLIPKA
jgi:hypothetical protein